MAIFERKRFVWYEPWFFQQRIRTAKSWMLFSLLLLAIAVAVGAGLYWAVPAAQRISLFELIGLSLGVAAAVWWVLDGTETRRQATLFEDSIVVGGDMGKYSAPSTYELAKIYGATIVLPDQSKWPAPGLYFLYGGTEQVIGIDPKVGLKRLAQAIHDVGIPIRLEGWHPSQENDFAKAYCWRATPGEVTARATIETLPAGTPSMMTPIGILLAIIRQCWAIALWLLITIAAIYYAYQHWNDLGLLRLGVLFVAVLASMYAAGVYTERIGSASTSYGLTRMALSQIRKRSGLQIDADAADLLPIEVFERSEFTKTVQRVYEMGFLQVDRSGRRILFEGKKQRWTLPADSVRSLAIEEVQAGTPGQSATGALTYYVTIHFAADEDREFGLRYSERPYGDFDDIKRAEGGIRVFEAIESVLDGDRSSQSA